MRKTAVGLITVFLSYTNLLVAQFHSMNVRPHVLVYKTRKDYRDLVPVSLSADKTKIASYPGPGDIKTGGALALPVLLHKGYLLDMRGIGVNSAFIKYTYEEYSNLNDPPSVSDMFGMIVDKDPLKELYDCGPRDDTKNSPAQLDKLIDRKQLKKKCIRMK